MKDFYAKNLRSIAFTARLLSAVLIVTILYYARDVLIPLALALFIAFALQPLVRRLVSWKFPRSLAVAATVGLFFISLSGIFYFIGGQLAEFAAQVPHYRENMILKAREARQMFSGGNLDKIMETVNEVKNEAGVAPEAEAKEVASVVANESESETLLDSIGSVTDHLATAGLVIVLVSLMLLQWQELRARFFSLIAGDINSKTTAIADAADRVGRFLVLQGLYNGGFGLLIWIALAVLGVPYAALWGLCAALLRYLPYVGPVIAAVLPVLFSIITSDGWSQVISISVLFLVLELISNNFIEPWLYGSKLGVSEIGIIMATVVWTYLWGPVGLLLATPLTVCLVVLGKHVPAFSLMARILGNEETLPASQQLYQRLLAGDSQEAKQIATQEIKANGFSHFMNQTLIPTLAHARRDQHAGWISTDSAEEFQEAVESLCEGLKLEHAEEVNDLETAKSDPSLTSPIILWSSCRLTDTLLPFLTTEMGLGRQVIHIKSSDLTGDALKSLAALSTPPKAITLVHLAEGDTPRAHSLLKKITRTLAGVPIQVARLAEAPLNELEKESSATSQPPACNLSEARAWAATFSTV